MRKISFLFIIVFLFCSVWGSFSFSANAATSAGYVWPASGVSMSQGYYPPGNSAGHAIHRGIDITGAYGSSIFAVKSGVILCASKNSTAKDSYCSNCTATGAGYHVLIKHNDGLLSIYSHLSDVNVSTGSTVSTGQMIGKMGSTGNSSGTHLHFAMYSNSFRNENSVNPLTHISPFSSVTATNITNTSATLYAYFGASATNIDSAGFYIGTSKSNLKKYTEVLNSNGIDGNGNYITHLYYGTNKWHGTLTPGTTYYYKFWMKAYDTIYETDIYSFTTTGECSHNWPAINETACNCYTGGSIEIQCPKCGQRKKYTFSQTIHDYSSSYTIDKVATCTEPGEKSKHCKRCDSRTSIYIIPATGHSYTYSPTLSYASTCTKAGEKVYMCSKCLATKSEVLPLSSHSYSLSWVVDKSATCTAAGSQSRHCTHTGCDAKTDIRTIPALGHAWDEGKITQNSSCAGSGVKTFTCKACKTTKTEAVSSNGHTWGEWTVLTKSTCISEGLNQRKCTKCSATETKTVAKTTHTYNVATTIDQEATCTQDGLSSIHCSICDSKTNISIIKATGHIFGEWKTIKEATPTEKGVSERTCEKCNTIEQQDIIPQSTSDHTHTFGDWVVLTPATCSSTGTQARKCNECEITETSTLATTEHKLGEWKIIKDSSSLDDSTLLEAGLAERKCEYCDYSQQTSFTSKNDITLDNSEYKEDITNANGNFETNVPNDDDINETKEDSNKPKKTFSELLPLIILGSFLLVLIGYVIVVLLKRKH